MSRIEDLKSIDACLNTVNLSKGAVSVFEVMPPMVPNSNFSRRNSRDDPVIVRPVSKHKSLKFAVGCGRITSENCDFSSFCELSGGAFSCLIVYNRVVWFG